MTAARSACVDRTRITELIHTIQSVYPLRGRGTPPQNQQRSHHAAKAFEELCRLTARTWGPCVSRMMESTGVPGWVREDLEAAARGEVYATALEYPLDANRRFEDFLHERLTGPVREAAIRFLPTGATYADARALNITATHHGAPASERTGELARRLWSSGQSMQHQVKNGLRRAHRTMPMLLAALDAKSLEELSLADSIATSDTALGVADRIDAEMALRRLRDEYPRHYDVLSRAFAIGRLAETRRVIAKDLGVSCARVGQIISESAAIMRWYTSDDDGPAATTRPPCVPRDCGPSIVYLLECQTVDGGSLIKIGITNCLSRRLRQLNDDPGPRATEWRPLDVSPILARQKIERLERTLKRVFGDVMKRPKAAYGKFEGSDETVFTWDLPVRTLAEVYRAAVDRGADPAELEGIAEMVSLT